MTATLDQSPDAHSWRFDGHRITQLCVDIGSVRLQSWSLQASLEVRVSVPFLLGEAGMATRAIDPGEPEELAPLLTLVGRTLDALRVTRTGAMTILFSDGTEIEVASHDRYEAFEVQGGGALEGVGYLARPGGGSPLE